MNAPQRLWSLWDMYQLPADQLVALARVLGAIEGRISDQNIQAALKTSAIPNNLRDTAPTQLGALKDQLKSIHLPVSAGFVEKIITETTTGKTVSNVAPLFEQLNNAIEIELQSKQFLGLTSEEEKFLFSKVFILGDSVEKKFPSTIEDGTESAKCMAFQCYTASVFHLMRVMEIGVQKFGEKLGIVLIDSRGKSKNWQNILDEADKAIRSLSQTDPATKNLAAISSNLYNVKIAWRNEVMHPKATYTEDEAKNVIVAVKAFMNELASVI